jgi:hypothetical protein
VLLQALFLESAKLFTALGSRLLRTLLMFMLMNGSERENVTGVRGRNINMSLLAVHCPSSSIEVLFTEPVTLLARVEK